jgi:hypothetical protein
MAIFICDFGTILPVAAWGLPLDALALDVLPLGGGSLGRHEALGSIRSPYSAKSRSAAEGGISAGRLKRPKSSGSANRVMRRR